MNGENGPSTDKASNFVPALLTDDQAAALWGISVRKFHELRASEPWVPTPVILGPRLLRYVRTEIEAATASMPRATLPAAEPVQLLKARAKRATTTTVTG